jgi:hypothetical protein
MCSALKARKHIDPNTVYVSACRLSGPPEVRTSAVVREQKKPIRFLPAKYCVGFTTDILYGKNKSKKCNYVASKLQNERN